MLDLDELSPAASAHPPAQRPYLSEFGHLLRVTVIYSRIMSHFAEQQAMLVKSGHSSPQLILRTGSDGRMEKKSQATVDAFDLCETSLHVSRFASMMVRLLMGCIALGAELAG